MNELSHCCQAPMEIRGNVTNYYVCTKCGRACDVIKEFRIGKEMDISDAEEIMDAKDLTDQYGKRIDFYEVYEIISRTDGIIALATSLENAMMLIERLNN